MSNQVYLAHPASSGGLG